MNVNPPDFPRNTFGAAAFGSALVIAGAFLLMQNFGLLHIRVSSLWPVVLIAIGVEGLLGSRRVNP